MHWQHERRRLPWVDLMYATMDSDVEGQPPIYNNHIEYCLYWVFFIFVGERAKYVCANEIKVVI